MTANGLSEKKNSILEINDLCFAYPEEKKRKNNENMRFFRRKYLPAISGTAIDVFQSEQIYRLPLGFSEIKTSASHLSIQRL